MKLRPADYLLAFCQRHRVPEPIREFKFYAPVRDWAFDWAWPAAKVALEIEGGVYGRGAKCRTCGRRKVGAHTSVERLLSDIEKYNLAALLGWKVIRATPDQVKDGTAEGWLARALTGR
jgi:hypothetical protein